MMKKWLWCVVFVCSLSAFPYAKGQSIFWVETTFANPAIGRANSDGSAALKLPLTPFTLPEGLAVDAGTNTVYWSELAFTGAGIKSTLPELTDSLPVVTGGSAFRGVAIDDAGGKLYWTSSNLVTHAMIRRADLNGGNSEVLLTLDSAESNLRGIAVDLAAEEIYWTDFDQGRIRKAAMTVGATAQNVLSGLNGPVGIAIDPAARTMYWTEANGGTIKRAGLDGSGSTTLLSGLARPNYLALDLGGGMMFWTEIDTPRIRKADLGGGNVTTLGITVNSPAGIACTQLHFAGVGSAPQDVPDEYALFQNYPNPFNPSTTIRYALARASDVDLVVYTTLGQVVAVLAHGPQTAGHHEVRFDGAGLASGVYFYRIRAVGSTDNRPAFTRVRPLVLIK